MIVPYKFYLLWQGESVINHNKILDKMRDELCRFCGADLTNFSICPECRKAVRRICTKCTRKTEEHLHLSCLSGIDFLQAKNPSANTIQSDGVKLPIAEVA